MSLRLLIVGLTLLSVFGGSSARAQDPPADARAYLDTLLEHEQASSQHRGHYMYMSEERSDRTGGRLWTEKIVETQQGRVRFLVAEDGQPVSPERAASERARLADDAANPDEFARREAGQKNDEEHARQMLVLLPKAFLFDPPAIEGSYVRLRYRPNPAYDPQSIEERVLHAMSGSVLIDRGMVRLRQVEGRLADDVGLGFGPFATVKAGSNFSTVRQHVDGNDWKTESVHTDINGKALFLKTLARKQEVRRWGYKKVADTLTVSDAVRLAEQ